MTCHPRIRLALSPRKTSGMAADLRSSFASVR
jgi:hypothetical protein